MEVRQPDFEKRKGRITGSVAGACLGLSPYMSPLAAWERIVERREEDPVSPDRKMRRDLGLFLEPFLARQWEERNGKFHGKLREMHFAVHPELPWLGATGDYDTEAGVLVDFKTSGQQPWDEPPESYVVQMHVQMAVYNRSSSMLSALFYSTMTMHDYWISRSSETERYINQLHDWHRAYVLSETPPPVDGSQAWHARLQREPDDPELVAIANEQTNRDARALQVARIEQTRVKQRRDLLEQRIKEAMGAATVLETSEGRFTWKRNRPSVKVDWESIALGLNPPKPLVALHTTTSPGPRVLRVPREWNVKVKDNDERSDF